MAKNTNQSKIDDVRAQFNDADDGTASAAVDAMKTLMERGYETHAAAALICRWALENGDFDQEDLGEAVTFLEKVVSLESSSDELETA